MTSGIWSRLATQDDTWQVVIVILLMLCVSFALQQFVVFYLPEFMLPANNHYFMRGEFDVIYNWHCS